MDKDSQQCFNVDIQTCAVESGPWRIAKLRKLLKSPPTLCSRQLWSTLTFNSLSEHLHFLSFPTWFMFNALALQWKYLGCSDRACVLGTFSADSYLKLSIDCHLAQTVSWNFNVTHNFMFISACYVISLRDVKNLGIYG